MAGRILEHLVAQVALQRNGDDRWDRCGAWHGHHVDAAAGCNSLLRANCRQRRGVNVMRSAIDAASANVWASTPSAADGSTRLPLQTDSNTETAGIDLSVSYNGLPVACIRVGTSTAACF
jgi:hypothetical protein